MESFIKQAKIANNFMRYVSCALKNDLPNNKRVLV